MAGLLGQTNPFLYEMVFAVRDLMQDAYPELIESSRQIAESSFCGGTSFKHTLDEGLRLLNIDLGNAVINRTSRPNRRRCSYKLESTSTGMASLLAQLILIANRVRRRL